jgi:hypothetical protein
MSVSVVKATLAAGGASVEIGDVPEAGRGVVNLADPVPSQLMFCNGALSGVFASIPGDIHQFLDRSRSESQSRGLAKPQVVLLEPDRELVYSEWQVAEGGTLTVSWSATDAGAGGAWMLDGPCGTGKPGQKPAEKPVAKTVGPAEAPRSTAALPAGARGKAVPDKALADKAAETSQAIAPPPARPSRQGRRNNTVPLAARPHVAPSRAVPALGPRSVEPGSDALAVDETATPVESAAGPRGAEPRRGAAARVVKPQPRNVPRSPAGTGQGPLILSVPMDDSDLQ